MLTSPGRVALADELLTVLGLNTFIMLPRYRAGVPVLGSDCHLRQPARMCVCVPGCVVAPRIHLASAAQTGRNVKGNCNEQRIKTKSLSQPTKVMPGMSGVE